MLEDKFNILKILRENNGLINITKLMDMITGGFKSELLAKNDELLLKFIFSKNISQADLDNFLEQWDIEVAGGHKALMLAYFMKMHPELKYSDYVEPRLKGLLKFYRFQNLRLMSHYTKICTELKKNNIDFLIFKGGCMKHLRPKYPRIMGDIDILVHEKDYKKCGQIAQKMGYDICRYIHSTDLHPKNSDIGIMDIHKYIVLNTKNEKKIIPDIFKRAEKQKVFGIETLVPCNEDLFFILLVGMVRNLRDKTSYTGILYNLFDCKFLIESKPDFDWDIIIQNAKKTGAEFHIYFAIQFLNSIVPDLLPEKMCVDSYFEKEFKKYCILLVYQRFFLGRMKEKGHEMKIRDLFSSFEFFKEYLKLKPKYFILKLGIIRKNPYITEKILNRACLHEN